MITKYFLVLTWKILFSAHFAFIFYDKAAVFSPATSIILGGHPTNGLFIFHSSFIDSVVWIAKVCNFLIWITYNNVREGEIDWIAFRCFPKCNPSAFQTTKKKLTWRLNVNCLFGLLSEPISFQSSSFSFSYSGWANQKDTGYPGKLNRLKFNRKRYFHSN